MHRRRHCCDKGRKKESERSESYRYRTGSCTGTKVESAFKYCTVLYYSDCSIGRTDRSIVRELVCTRTLTGTGTGTINQLKRKLVSTKSNELIFILITLLCRAEPGFYVCLLTDVDKKSKYCCR